MDKDENERKTFHFEFVSATDFRNKKNGSAIFYLLWTDLSGDTMN